MYMKKWDLPLALLCHSPVADPEFSNMGAGDAEGVET